ncbi:hypothetical protein BURK1_02468 [Burkholderiales bacterium]|nr:hypothetical protein BURK1_02468 [Burkholderiales bacterium]
MSDARPAADPLRPDAIIAGTLSLMSCYAQHPAPAHAGRIADNLMRLSGSAALTAEFRAVCRRMAGRWLALQAQAIERCERGVGVVDTRVLQ